MQRFAALYARLDDSTSTEAKVTAMVDYLATAPLADAAWAVYFLAGGRPHQTVPTALLRATATAAAGLPDWLFDASYRAVGDLAETIAQVMPPPTSHSALGLDDWMHTRLLPLRGTGAAAQAAALRHWFDELPPDQRFVLVKLIGGGLRVGVSRLLVQRALARHAGIDDKRMAQRMVGTTTAKTLPSAQSLRALLAPDDAPAHTGGQPYPFFLAHAPEASGTTWPESLGPRSDWLAEWKYDGIRAQVVCRAGSVWIWSRGEELITERFPEVVAACQALPSGTVLDGELLVWKDGAPASFQLLQQRITRKTLGRKLLADAPVAFIAYDLLEADGVDLRTLPQHVRRARLEAVVACRGLAVSPLLEGDDWAALAAQRATSRGRGVEGLMLKHRDAAYGTGRTKRDGVWWKWKLDPYRVDGVLIYAQAGHGRRSGLYTDYTFAVWNRPPADPAEAEAVVLAIAEGRPPQPEGLQLVAFTKAYSGLTDAEFQQVDRVIRSQTLERFGPVRSVRPSLVFELGFEGIQSSQRHKSGVAVRFPRMLRLRADKPLHEADNLLTLRAMMG